MQRLILWFSHRSKPWVIGVGLLGIALVSLLDYLSGPNAEVSILYVLVVLFVAWFADVAAGFFIAGTAFVGTFLANLYAPITRWSEVMLDGWNSAMDFAVFLAVVFMVAGIKKSGEQRRRAEETTHTMQTLLGSYVDTAMDGIITIDDQNVIGSFNPAAERIFGYTAADVIGQDIRLLVPPPLGNGHDIRNYLPSDRDGIIAVSREVLGQRKDGSFFPAELAAGEVRLEGRKAITLSLRDVTERRSLEKQVLEISEQERTRIALDLHDGLCQHLAATEFATQLLADRLSKQSSPQSAEAKQIVGFIQQAMTQAREIAHGLHPVEIGPGGLLAALDDLAASVQNTFRVTCAIRADRTAGLMEDQAATQVYRIVQEAVMNAVKHGKPSRIQIVLRDEAKGLVLTVTDNGLGFPERPPRNKGMGLSIMNYRACMIGATLAVRREPGGGTAVILSLPGDIYTPKRNDS